VIGETVAQVKGAKPRFKPAGKTSEITRQRVSELSEAYLEARNAKLRSQAFLAETQAREKAGELISRELVSRQAQYIFLCLRQAVLNFPALYARRIIGITDEHQARENSHQGRSSIPHRAGGLPAKGHRSQLAGECRSRWPADQGGSGKGQATPTPEDRDDAQIASQGEDRFTLLAARTLTPFDVHEVRNVLAKVPRFRS
jgi:hypothetical protein